MLPTRLITAFTFFSSILTSLTPAHSATLTATKSADAIVIESTGGPITYKAIVDPKKGSDITDLQLPADGPIVARELNDIFFLGQHAQDFTLRGWTGPSKFIQSCSVDLLSRTPDQAVVRVHLQTTGTYRILATEEPAKSTLRKSHSNYKDKTLVATRTYTFKPDGITIEDQLLWLHPETQFKTFYLTAAFMPRAAQSPVSMVNPTARATLFGATSGGKKVPPPVGYPFTAVNFLKNGYKISLLTTASSFDVGNSDTYFYEKPWQQDWYQLSGFMFRLTAEPAAKPVKLTTQIEFAKATPHEMPPVITIHSPTWESRWLDEKGETPKAKIGNIIELSASALNSDGTPVPDKDISWDIHIDPWWNTPSALLPGPRHSYKLPDVANEAVKTTSKDRQLLLVMWVKARGNNGTESVEPFTMLVGKSEK
jgi:hypothetical protein